MKRNIAKMHKPDKLIDNENVRPKEGTDRKKSGGNEVYQEVSFKTEQVIYAHTRSDEADMEYKMHCHNSSRGFII